LDEASKRPLLRIYGTTSRAATNKGQQALAKIPRVGILSDEARPRAFEPFSQELRDLGYVEGQNIAFDCRYAAENYAMLPNLASELVSLHPDVILAHRYTGRARC
jgi:putative tryptophan/tyrosine transport system substrate-binding protein